MTDPPRSDAWQLGREAAEDQHESSPLALLNPFAPGTDAWGGFEERAAELEGRET
jgi:hypothetical protein